MTSAGARARLHTFVTISGCRPQFAQFATHPTYHDRATPSDSYDLYNIILTMAPKKENSKKVAGNARKAEAAAKKSAVEDAKREAAEDEKWSKGSKNNSKK